MAANVNREVAKARLTGEDPEAPALLDAAPWPASSGCSTPSIRTDPDPSNDEQDVSLFVHLIGDPLVSPPGEQGDGQIFARQAPRSVLDMSPR
jgi:hypothetical protein